MKGKIYLNLRYAKKESTKGYILDIGTTGVAIAASVRIRKNTAVDMMFSPKGSPLLRGKVVNTHKRNRRTYSYRLGIKFVSLNRQRKDFLNRLMSQYLHKRRVPRFNLM